VRHPVGHDVAGSLSHKAADEVADEIEGVANAAVPAAALPPPTSFASAQAEALCHSMLSVAAYIMGESAFFAGNADENRAAKEAAGAS
jgi:hypothetical protein